MERIEHRLLPTTLQGDWRAAFLLRSWGFAIGFAVVFGSLAATQRLWELAALLWGLFLGGALCVVLLHKTGSLRVMTHVSLAITTPVLAGAGLLQNPPNPIAPVFLVLVPLLAGFVISPRAGRVWLWITLVVGFGAEWLMANGYHLHGPLRPRFGLVMAMNLVAIVSLVVSFVRWFDGLRAVALERLEVATRARTVFLANVSHEIRTPMNGVLGLTELVLRGELSVEQRERIELVKRSGQSMVRLIDDLLLVARAESGRLVLAPQPTVLRELVADATGLFRAAALEKGLRLESRVADDVPAAALLDGARLSQVVINLLSNAVKFTERGAVELKLFVKAGRLLIRLRDDGPGMGAEVLARLFRPFEQADASTTRRYGGTGLGLALSRQLIEAMGGSLTVTSTVGVGSVFTVELPLSPVDPGEVTPRGSPQESGGAQSPVLVVDDNAINLLVARGLVERAGFTVQLARNGKEAVDAVASTRFSLVLMDCQMPEMDGLEATRLIRASETSRTPIVALTASGLPEELAACKAAGMDDCLLKPVTPEMIERALTWARRR